MHDGREQEWIGLTDLTAAHNGTYPPRRPICRHFLFLSPTYLHSSYDIQIYHQASDALVMSSIEEVQLSGLVCFVPVHVTIYVVATHEIHPSGTCAHAHRFQSQT